MTRDQAVRMFTRFYPVRKSKSYPRQDGSQPLLDEAALKDLATRFADLLPEKTFSAAALQGFLLQWKDDPMGAISGTPAFVTEYEAKTAQSSSTDSARMEDDADSPTTSKGESSAGADSAEEAVKSGE